MKSEIKNSTQALLLILVLCITAPNDRLSRIAGRDADDLVERFDIPEEVVEACKALALKLIVEHKATYFAVGRDGNKSMVGFLTFKERNRFLKEDSGSVAIHNNAALPSLWDKISRGHENTLTNTTISSQLWLMRR